MRLLEGPADVANASTAVVVGTSAPATRRSVGPVAWCVLEALIAAQLPGRDEAVASTRTLAVDLGLSKNTVHRALAVLRDAGVLHAKQDRSALGRFTLGRYRLAVAHDVLAPLVALGAGAEETPALVETLELGGPMSSARRARSAQRRRARADQLSLLAEF